MKDVPPSQEDGHIDAATVVIQPLCCLGAPDKHHTQPGLPCNDASIDTALMIGDFDSSKGGEHPFKSEAWEDHLCTPKEYAVIAKEKE
eukprot:13447709-Ditylum_brightwellii.AAC.1